MTEPTDASAIEKMKRFWESERTEKVTLQPHPPYVEGETLTDAMTDVLERHSHEVGSSIPPAVLADIFVKCLSAVVAIEKLPPEEPKPRQDRDSLWRRSAE